MEFIAKTKEFNTALQKLNPIVNKKPNIPILANVCITLTHNQCLLHTTDIDTHLTQVIPVTCNEDFSFTTPITLLLESTKKITTEELKIKYDPEKQNLHIASGRVKYKITTTESKQFAKLPTIDTDSVTIISLNALLLKQMIDSTAIAMSTDESRLNLNGIYMHNTEQHGLNHFTLVASDAHILSLNTQPAEFNLPKGFILPKKTIDVLKTLLDSKNDQQVVEMQINEQASLVKFTLVESLTTIYSKTVDGTFPNYKPVIPLTNKKRTLVNKLELIHAIDSVSFISSESKKDQYLFFHIKESTILIQTPPASANEGNYELNIESVDFDLKIALSIERLNAILKVVQTQSVELWLNDSNSSVLIKEFEPETATKTFVLMPIRL